jgi:hypothetical protein
MPPAVWNVVVPIPTLPFDTVMGDPMVPVGGFPVYMGTVSVVCATAPADTNANHKPSHIHADLLIVPNPFIQSFGVFSDSRLALNWTALVALTAGKIETTMPSTLGPNIGHGPQLLVHDT